MKFTDNRMIDNDVNTAIKIAMYVIIVSITLLLIFFFQNFSSQIL